MINATIDGTQYSGVDKIVTGGKTVALEETGITPSGTKTITENGTDIDVFEFAYVDVNVSGSSERDGGLLHDSVAHDLYVGDAISSLGAPMTKTTVTEGSYYVTLDDSYAGTKVFNNQRFGWVNVIIENGKTYELTFDSVSEAFFIYGLKYYSVYCGSGSLEYVSGSQSNLNGNARVSTSGTTFTASADYSAFLITPATGVHVNAFTIVNPKLVEVTG